MAYAVAAIGVLTAVLGGLGVAAPAGMRLLAEKMKTPRAIYAVVGARIVIGAFFVFASEACAWPMAVGTLGVLTMVAGFAGLFLGFDRMIALVDWVMGTSDNVIRGWALIAVLAGAFVVYAAVL